MSESPAAAPQVPIPDPRFNQFPIPGTVDEVVARIVKFVGFGVHDAGGPSFSFEVNAAEVDFKQHWGRFVEYQLNRFPENPWPRQWMNVVHIAKLHGKYAVDRAKAAGRKPVSREDFVEGGKQAAEECAIMFGRGRSTEFRGCWCNDC